MGARAIILLLLWFVRSIAPYSEFPEEVAVKGIQGNNDPELTEELRARGGLPNFFSRLNAGDTVRVAYMGGSITMQKGWRIKTFAWSPPLASGC